MPRKTAEGRREYEQMRQARDGLKRNAIRLAKYYALSDSRKLEIRLQKYGLTLEQFDDLWAKQGGNCAACTTILERDNSDDKNWFHIDHDHQTSIVRGILCGACNRALGHAKESAMRLRGVATYIESHL